MFIKSVVSRAGRVVVSADQLRVALRVGRRIAAERHNAAVYERLRDDFGGYLVSEPVVELPVWRGLDGRVVLIPIGTPRVRGLVGDDGVDGEWIESMDAPEFLPRGSVQAYEASGEVCAVVSMVLRDWWCV